MNREDGFSLIEVMVATAVITLVGMIALQSMVLATTVLAASHRIMSATDMDGASRLAAQLRAEARTASGIQASGGNRVTFYGTDDGGNAHYWDYTVGAQGQVVREDFGSAPRSVPATSVINEVTSLTARTIAGSELVSTAANSKYGGALQGASVPGTYDVPVSARSGAANIAGGNHVVEVSLGTKSSRETIHLLGGTMPSGFTIVGAPSFHAVVWREDSITRKWFGLVAQTNAFVFGRVSISYNHGKTWTPWCDRILIHNVYAGHQSFWARADKDATFNPNDPLERSDSLLKACVAKHNPLPNVLTTPAANWTRSPEVIETPPPGTTPPPPSYTPPPGVNLPADYCAANPGAPICRRSRSRART